MTGPRSHEDWVREQLCRLGDDFISLEAIIGRATGHHWGTNGAGLPVREDVVDLQKELERTALRLRYRAAVLLGRKVPPIPLSKRYFVPCPHCEANSLWVIPDGWYVACRNPECADPEGRRHEWHDWAELEHLRDMVAALVADWLANPESPEPQHVSVLNRRARLLRQAALTLGRRAHHGDPPLWHDLLEEAYAVAAEAALLVAWYGAEHGEAFYHGRADDGEDPEQLYVGWALADGEVPAPSGQRVETVRTKGEML